MSQQESDRAYFIKLARMRMPFGKYANRLLIDIPESYILWLQQKGVVSGELGTMLQIVYEIKVNGLEYLFDPVKEK
ncbi:MAG: DUF3820 family protein [Endomicrobiales bacterium]